MGRRAEVAALEALLSAVRRGSGAVLVLEGEAGIGKSRLVGELVDAAGSGIRVLLGAADELDPDRPFAALAEALGLAGAEPDPERAALSRLIVGDDPAPQGVPADLGFRIVESVLALLERLSADGPVVLAVEDAHWADPSTARALGAVGRRALAALAVGLVVTRRPFPRRPDLDRVVDDLEARGASRLRLGPLGPEEAAELAVAAGGSADRAGEAGGNPLLIIELATAGGDGPVAPTVAATVGRRIASLPRPAVEALEMASVLGRRFSVDHLARLMGTSPARLVGSLEDAMAAGVLGQQGGELSFRHELIREAVYRGVPVPLRRALHRQAARELEAAGAPPSRVAEHLLSGADPGDADAVRGLAAAARLAAPRSPASAVRLLEGAVALSGPDGDGADDLAASLAPLLIQTGRAQEAGALARRMLARGPEPATEAALRRALGEVLWTQGMTEAAVAELEAAGGIAGAPATGRAGALALAANLRLFLGEPERAVEEAQKAVAAGERLGDDVARCLGLQTLAVAAGARAEVAEAQGLARRAVVTARHSGDPRVGHLHPHLFLGLLLFDADRLDEAEVVLQEGRRRAEERGTVVWLPLYHCVLAMRCLMLGSLDDGLAEVDAGLALADEVGTRLYVPLLHGMAAWVACQRGEIASGQAHMDAAAAAFLATTSEEWQAEASGTLAAVSARWPLEWGLWVTGLLAEARGDAAAALESVAAAWSVAAPLRYFLGYRLFGTDLVRLSVQAGRHDRAAAVAAEVEAGAARSGTASARAAALRCRGLVDSDAGALCAAATAARNSPHVLELAAICEDAGAALARAGRPAEAAAHFEEALAHFGRAGATRAASRVEAGLRSLGVRPRRPPAANRPAAGWGSLTPTEMRVARLAAEGLTNRQIGEQLFVSRRTVETHLAHAYAKLGLSSRAQLAAEVARRA